MRGMRGRPDERGAVGVALALILPMLILFMAVAVDVGRLVYVRSTLQGVLDSGALAAGKAAIPSTATTRSAIETSLSNEAQKFVSANLRLSPALATVTGVAASYTAPVGTAAGGVELTLSATVPLAFARVIGVPSVTMTVRSQVNRPQQGPVEVALVLDQTNSMNETLSGSTKKIDALKSAAASLAATVMKLPDGSSNPNAKVGVIPFTAFINLAGTPISPVPSWVNPPPDRTLCTYASTCYKSCTIDGSAASCLDPSLPGCPAPTCTVRKWSGCITTRVYGFRDNLDKPTDVGPPDARYPGVFAVCAYGIRPLTSSYSTFTSYLNGLTTIPQDTFIPIGLVWGWNMLTPDAPLTEAADATSLSAIGGRKALVLVTDGASTVYPKPDDSGSYLPYSSTTAVANGQDPITLTQNLCNNIKTAGIAVYTIRVKVADTATTNALINCASDPSKSFDVQNTSDLNTAFASIGASLQALKIVK